MQDIAAKVLAFAKQRPRALCILSANGTVSAVTLRPPASSGSTVTYEVNLHFLCEKYSKKYTNIQSDFCVNYIFAP